MTILTLDMRVGRTDTQKREFASAVLDVISRTTGEPRENIVLVLREAPGLHFVENNQHLPDFGASAPSP